MYSGGNTEIKLSYVDFEIQAGIYLLFNITWI